MKSQKAEKKNAKTLNPSWVRASISFPPEIYSALADLAKQKKVSLAWIVRDAAERYIAVPTSKARDKTSQ
jgi:hypothetical protein